jgi:uncharacterized protein
MNVKALAIGGSVIALLLALLWGAWQRGNAKDAELEAVRDLLAQQQAQTAEANRLAQERAAALAEREATLASLDTQTRAYRNRIAALTRSPPPGENPDDYGPESCLHRPLPVGIQRVLAEAFPDPGQPGR